MLSHTHSHFHTRSLPLSHTHHDIIIYMQIQREVNQLIETLDEDGNGTIEESELFQFTWEGISQVPCPILFYLY